MSENTIFLGETPEHAPVFWAPKREKNPHFMVLGTSGSGKTETLKILIHEFSRQDIPTLIIDFHDDFTDLAENTLDFTNTTINPLDYGHGETPEMVMYKVTNVLGKIFSLGIQQQGVLQDAIEQSYKDKDIDMKSQVPPKDIPTFDDIKEHLEQMIDIYKDEHRGTQTIETLMVRLRPLFDTGFFSKKQSVPFQSIFDETTVLNLKGLPTDEVKFSVAEFFLSKLKYELYARGKTDKLRLFCIVDEAHRLVDDRSPLNELMRESRKYGTGVILASQRPGDFSETVLANVGGIVCFQCRLDKDARFVAKQINIPFEKIIDLNEIGTAYVNLSSTSATKLVKIRPLWKRSTLEKKRKKTKAKNEHSVPRENVQSKSAVLRVTKPEVQEDDTKDDESEVEEELRFEDHHVLPSVFLPIERGAARFFTVRNTILFAVMFGLSLVFAGLYTLVWFAAFLVYLGWYGKLKKKIK
ncbi:MAG: ATP-binding protein [Candidatus Aenigmarchaeota archaeon]|nr:ATP-binding protein [Candidatus Aenigmarchaeota archaeon]